MAWLKTPARDDAPVDPLNRQGAPRQCEADDCDAEGRWRRDYEAFLCNTHAEIPSYE
jgi:hypothetical protein